MRSVGVLFNVYISCPFIMWKFILLLNGIASLWYYMFLSQGIEWSLFAMYFDRGRERAKSWTISNRWDVCCCFLILQPCGLLWLFWLLWPFCIPLDPISPRKYVFHFRWFLYLHYIKWYVKDGIFMLIRNLGNDWRGPLFHPKYTIQYTLKVFHPVRFQQLAA